jgi:inner membrane transporter RhtA
MSNIPSASASISDIDRSMQMGATTTRDRFVILHTPARRSSGRFGALTALVVAMASFQVGASIAKHLIPQIGAPGTTALRLGVSALIMAALQRPWRALPAPAARRVLLVYGLSLGTMNFVFYMALRTIPLGIAVSLEFLGPLAVALIGSRRHLDFLWIALAVTGLVFLLPITRASGRLDPVGVGFALAAGCCWALYIVFGQRAGHAHGAAASTWGMIIAAFLVVPVGVASAGRTLLSPGVLSLGLGVAVLSSALPYTLEMIALRQLSSKTYGTLMSLEPALAALAGLVLLHEHLSLVQWMAIGSVILAAVGTLGDTNADPLT